MCSRTTYATLYLTIRHIPHGVPATTNTPNHLIFKYSIPSQAQRERPSKQEATHGLKDALDLQRTVYASRSTVYVARRASCKLQRATYNRSVCAAAHTLAIDNRATGVQAHRNLQNFKRSPPPGRTDAFSRTPPASPSYDRLLSVLGSYIPRQPN